MYTFRYRFDELGVELFSDSDRLSYTSLSRSSSLIQFESLERQLQSDSQISGSSPSLYSYEGVSTTTLNGPAAHNNQEIKSEPIAINSLPTIRVTNPPIQFTNSDSEPFSSSSTSGSYSSDDSEIHREKKIVVIANDLSSEEKPSGSNASCTNAPMSQLDENRKKYLNSFRAKNSVDSLSEDSGYCDRDIRSLPAGALSLDSSLPTGNDLEDEEGNVIEEKSILRDAKQFLLAPRLRSHSDDDDICYHSMENLNRRLKTRSVDLLDEINVESMAPPRKMPTTTKSVKIESPNVHGPNEHKPMFKNKHEENSHQQAQSEKLISISLPELSANGDISRTSRSKLKRKSCDEFGDPFSSVSSVPDYINLTCESSDFTPSWIEPCESIASKNFNLYDLNYGQSASVHKHQPKTVDISASCANLTLLNYSDDDEFCYDSRKLMSINRSKSQTMSGKMPVNVYSSDDDDDAYIASYRSKELSSLLEEISAHFDKNLSILNDREASYEPRIDVKVKSESPPKPPPRRSQIKTSPNHAAPKNATFDRDPTNLVTTYAQSLEKCSFDVDAPINVYSSRQNLYLPADGVDGARKDDLPQSTPIKKRNFVSSTPNLNYFDLSMRHINHYSSTDNTTLVHDNLLLSPGGDDDNRCTSMKEIASSSTGILASHSTAGSKGGLSVSFCPIVSEISWQETVDDDDFSDDVEMDPNGEQYSSSRNDSLVNYYNNNDDDDDEEEDFDDFIAVATPCVVDHREPPTQAHTVNDENNRAMIAHATSTQTAKECEAALDAPTSASVSQKMLVETQTPSEKFIAVEASAGVMEPKVNSQLLTTVPHKVAMEPPPVPPKSGKQKKSIFARLSSGFRFSFRGKKNKKLSNDGVVHYPPSESNNNAKQGTKTTIEGDGIFIPLKDPNDNVRNFQYDGQQQQQLANGSQKLQQREAEAGALDRQSRSMNQRESPPRPGQVMGKPPLPKQPPRIVGTTTKRPSTHAPRASSTPREAESDGGEFYHQSMIGDGLKQYYSGGSRTMGTLGSEHKIGLIETNLDTDETIINGKTQSLMELGIGQGRMSGMQVMQDVNSVGGAGGESGRPHKSMEFLLDKENHQRVLVSVIKDFLLYFLYLIFGS